MAAVRKFSDEVCDLIVKLHDEGMSFRAIGIYLGINHNTACDAYQRHARQSFRNHNKRPVSEAKTVPEDVLAERDRVNKRPWTIEVDLLGSPPPGRSALDQRTRA